jgi:hypothetical protein
MSIHVHNSNNPKVYYSPLSFVSLKSAVTATAQPRDSGETKLCVERCFGVFIGLSASGRPGRVVVRTAHAVMMVVPRQGLEVPAVSGFADPVVMFDKSLTLLIVETVSMRLVVQRVEGIVLEDLWIETAVVVGHEPLVHVAKIHVLLTSMTH